MRVFPVRGNPIKLHDKNFFGRRVIHRSCGEQLQRALLASVNNSGTAISLYAVEWAGYFRELKANPDPKLVTLYIGIQMNAQDHGMLADLMDTISGLREPYREAWLAESEPYRLGTALARWDAECQFWRATWGRVNELLRTRGKDEPFPSIDVLRARR